MKKIFSICMLALITMVSCAQDAAKATKMTQQEVQAAVAPLMAKLQEIPEDIPEEEGMAKVKELAVEFVKANKTDAGAMVVTNILQQVMEADELVKFVNSDDYLKSHAQVVSMLTSLRKQQETAEGKMFADFSAEYEGKVTKLSDYVGKGKYVLVDFWASWCGPCKREIPNLIAAYNKYKGDKFEVLGVATWDKPEDTKKSIEQLGIPYPQMLNAQNAGSDAYGINGIPQIILFGPDGTILKRNLRGEGIETALAEIFK